MKTSLFLGTSLGLLLLCGTASATTLNITVTMNGMQEVPAVSTTATGTGDLEFDTATGKLTGMVTLTGLADATAAHIHQGACGVSGAVAVPLTADKSMLMIDEQLDDATATALTTGELYLNVHTTAHGDGEIRGQLVPPGGKGCGDDPKPDAGASSSSGSTSSGGTDAGATSSSSGSSGSNGAVTTRPSDGTTPASSSSSSSGGGCSTSGSTSGGAALAVGVGLALAALSRGRRRR